MLVLMLMGAQCAFFEYTWEFQHEPECDAIELAAGEEVALTSPTIIGPGNSDSEPGHPINVGAAIEIGDINSDGSRDVILGSYDRDSQQGGVWIVYGPLTGDEYDLATLSEDQMSTISGSKGDIGQTGHSLDYGDVTGEGTGDLLVSSNRWIACDAYLDKYAPDASPAVGYLFAGPITDSLRFQDASTTFFLDLPEEGSEDDNRCAGWRIVGHASGLVAISDPTSGPDDVGGVFLLETPLEDAVDLGEERFLEGPVAYGLAGRDLVLDADLDGDGLDELLVGAPGHNGQSLDGGRTFVLRGGAVYVLSDPLNTAALDDADYTFYSLVDEDRIGGQLAAVGDVNGDGTEDLLIGSQNTTFEEADYTETVAYLITDITQDGDVSETPLRFIDIDITTQAPQSVVAADFDGDCFSDLLMSDPEIRGSYGPGRSYLFFSPFDGTYAMDDADIIWTSSQSDAASGYAAAFGDVTGGGRGDLLINAWSVEDKISGIYLLEGEGGFGL